MRTTLFIVVLGFFAAVANAGQVYQCGDAFQDRPCAGGASKVIGKYDQSTSQDSDSITNQQKQEEQQKQIDADIKKRYDDEVAAANRAQHASSDDRAKSDAIRQHRVIEGMDKKEVIKSLGDPDRKKQVTTKYGFREEWTYVKDWGNKDYVYFDGDSVSEVSLTDSHIE